MSVGAGSQLTTGTPAGPDQVTPGPLRPAAGLSLLGAEPGSAFTEPRFLVRRADGQVIPLSRLPYLVVVAVAEAVAEATAPGTGGMRTGGMRASGMRAGGADADLIAARVSQSSGQLVSAADVRALIASQLAPLGVVTAGMPGQVPARAPDVPTGAGRKPPGPHRRTVVLGAALALAAASGAALAALAVSRPGPVPAPVSASEVQTAAWVTRQVSPGTTVSCDPVMCGLLRQDGFPAARLLTLGPATRDPLGSGVVVATTAVRNEFGARLATVYAPLVLAGYGAGPDRVQVRATAPDGAAALTAQLAAQRALLASEGRALLQNRTIRATPAARSTLRAGHVDPRLMAILSVLSGQLPIQLVAFDAAPPGASAAVPVRGIQLGAASASSRSAILAFLRVQRGTYRPAVAAVTRGAGGQPVVTVRFYAPDPLASP
ncbi:MAG TPA: hypothetical protein VGD68_08110 [Streptosporangiaceae bacterium]